MAIPTCMLALRYLTVIGPQPANCVTATTPCLLCNKHHSAHEDNFWRIMVAFVIIPIANAMGAGSSTTLKQIIDDHNISIEFSNYFNKLQLDAYWGDVKVLSGSFPDFTSNVEPYFDAQLPNDRLEWKRTEPAIGGFSLWATSSDIDWKAHLSVLRT